jgi:hypothetical protein
MSTSLSGLEQEMSKLKVERDMTLAEVEELSAAKRCAFPRIVQVGALTISSLLQFTTGTSRTYPVCAL